MTRWSTPSNRPQTIRGPGPAASSTTQGWFNGRPRGLISSLGRSLGRPGAASAASMASASTSARITMPGPPAAGVSSTLRWRSVAESRMARAASAHRPDASALPARLTPSGPGNISGNRVRTVARQVIRKVTELLRPSYAGSTRVSIIFAKRWIAGSSPAMTTGVRILALDLIRQFDHHTPAPKIDPGHHGMGERQQHGRAIRRCDLDDIAGAEIVDRDNAAKRLARGIHRGEPDQVGVVIFILADVRQFFARDIEFDAIETFGLLARRDALQRRDQMPFRLAHVRHLELTRAVLCHERAIVLYRQCVFRERPKLHRTAHTMRGADSGDANRCCHHRPPLHLRRLGGGFGLRFTPPALHRLFRIVSLGTFCHAGGIEEARHPVRGLRALGEPGLDLFHVELQPRLVVLPQQRIEMPQPFDEAAVARKARVRDDDVIDRAFLAACARKADND